MNYMIDIDQILIDVSTYTSDGIIDFTKPAHITLLREALIHYGYDELLVREYIKDVHANAKLILEKGGAGGSQASKDAHKKGLVHLGGAYWASPGNPDMVTAVSMNGGQTLKSIKPTSLKDMKAKEGNKKSQPTKPNAPPATAKKVPSKKPIASPEVSKPYAKSAEVSHGLYSNEYRKITTGGKTVEVRQIVDESGQPIDISTPKGVTKANQVLVKRLEKFRPKIVDAARLLSDDVMLKKFNIKNPGVTKTLIQKWVGEVGEIKALQELLAVGVQAHMLTASAPKNDIVAFVGSKERGLKMAFYSVKSTKQGEEPNQLGANVRKDVLTYLNDVENSDIAVAVAGKKYKVDSKDYVNVTMDIKAAFYNELSRGITGRDGVDVSSLGKPQLMPGAEKGIKKLTGKRRGFEKQGEFLQSRKVTGDDIKKIFDSPDIDKRILASYEKLGIPIKNYAGTKALLRAQLSEMIAARATSLAGLSAWLEKNMAEAFDKTGAKATPTSDLIAFHMNTKSGYDDSSVGIITAESALDEYTKKYGDLSKLDGMSMIKKVIGLSQRSRGLGDVKKGTGYIDSIDNGMPTVSLVKREQRISDYVKSVGSTK